MRTVPIRFFILAIFCLCAFFLVYGNTARAQQSCPVTVVPKIPAAGNLFSSEQERSLGDIEAGWLESNYPVVPDEEYAAYLNAIADRIAAQFPGHSPRVRVILLEAPEANSFSAGPERIYVTRRMIASVKNDDELAGLLGHEMDHIVTHQNAILVSRLFREILGVASVSDRKDISEKLWRVMESIDRDPKLLRKAAQMVAREEYEADRVALYASAAAGFSPQAYEELFARSAEIKHNTGSFISDFFGETTPNQWRLREIDRTLRWLPRRCREVVPAASAEFRTWQAAVVSYPHLATR